MKRVVFAVVLSLSCLIARSTSIPAAGPSRFEIVVPDRMVTGNVLVRAEVADEKVSSVKWYIGDWAKTTARPFELVVDLGPFPAERRVRALALDTGRQTLYERVAVMNRGGRGLGIEFLSPVNGEGVSGATPVRVRVRLPSDDAVASVTVGKETDEVRLEPTGGDGVYASAIEVPQGATPLVARLETRRGRVAQASVILNARGISASSEAHVVEQMVSVTRSGTPVVNLTKSDFDVRDDRGLCEIREVRLVRDTPLAVGFAVDTSISLAHNRALLKETATRFIDQCFKAGDAGFIQSFGPVVSRVSEWTDLKASLAKDFEDLPDTDLMGTNLYEAVVKSLYQFQGSQGARALVLVTDGEDYDGDVTERDAIAYAKQSGVPIYALALTTLSQRFDAYDPKAKPVMVEDPPNTTALTRLTDATGGRTYAVKKGEDMRGVFQKIEKEIRTQYLVSYVSNARSQNAFHPVEVKSRHGVVHTAAGFFF